MACPQTQHILPGDWGSSELEDIRRVCVSSAGALWSQLSEDGLAPILVNVVFDLIESLRAQGRTLLVVEQNATRMLDLADRAYVLRSGEVVAEGTGAELRGNKDLFDTFVGN
jgi:branched-chain amino acid transport system ATP-binding protein